MPLRMYVPRRLRDAIWITLLAATLAACAPKVGSERWCEAMQDKPKGDWSSNDAAAFAKHCVLGLKPEA